MKLACLFVVPLVSARVVRPQAQIPIVGQVGNIETEIVQSSAQNITEEIAPAIGIHFTTSYAVAAARYENGTTRDLLRVAGDAEYIDLMSRWTVWEEDTKSFYW
jgi:L-cystine uptake protein TcyP (sodium:dicarboxylate symporter family)